VRRFTKYETREENAKVAVAANQNKQLKRFVW
jgi:hypothetical protein